ncbi:MAG: PEP/pyruvate-binding domain-containing protein, partial [Candidatus Thermoplasmatota archaeon]|nr:PEP/pyruvate-binding domain-containing protein [Candidatus Thermoplasmatota archaeon]
KAGEGISHSSRIQEDFEETYELRSQIYHALMPFRVKDILIVSSLYDAFIIEEEGLIAELVIGEYQHLLLSAPPRVTRVSSGEKALSKLKERRYDLVITMAKNIGMDPFEFGKKIKEIRPDMPVILLATDRADINLFQEENIAGSGIDKIFAWTGNPALFLAIIKYVEDSMNVRYDTVNGNVRVLIMVEDSIYYYSMLLPILLTEVVQQTRRSLSDDLNEMQRLLRRRARPKILLATTYEEADYYYKKYKDYLLGVLCDVSFKQRGQVNPVAGHEFLQMIRKQLPHLPLLMQSSEVKNKEKADELDAYFLNKNSPTLVQDFQHFLLNHLGFGDFVFLLPKREKHPKKKTYELKPEGIHVQTTEIARASNMKEFEEVLQKVPLESILFHSERNHFSNWLMARCEFDLANELRPKKVSDFPDLNAIREHLIGVFNNARRNKQRGVITDFSKQKFEFDSSFTRLRGDSLGGKGRGLAFMRAVLTRYKIDEKYNDVIVKVPNSVVIGTLEFDRFVNDNNLYRFFENEELSDEEIAKEFLKCEICDELKQNLMTVLQHFKTPIAVRSSSLLEDYQNHPFAGMYDTFLLPNNHEDDNVRLQQLCHAIKLIYASVFYKEPKAYAESLSLKIEEEKMAIVIQELIGQEYNGRFYPTLSGIARSYNFYPISHQTAEDGIANIAVGFGKAVVGGEKVFRFSPRYPDLNPDFSTPESALEHSQRELYVLDTSNKYIDLNEPKIDTCKKLRINDIIRDGSLDLVASTYDRNDGVIRDGLSDGGFPIITFAGILKYDAFPLAPILQDILVVGQKGMGCPVEFEFAVNIDPTNKTPPTFAILQIRPFVIAQEKYDIQLDKIKQEQIFIRSNRALGNGLIDNIRDIVYIPFESFDSSKTVEMAEEIGVINKKLVASSSPYLLIGPGRWGTQDRWLGVPVRWGQISGVRVIVETALENFNIKPSQGTHFFQNMISRGIGYIDIPLHSKECTIDWSWLDGQTLNEKMKFVNHVHLTFPVIVKIDGRSGHAVIIKPEKQKVE